jgi:hypothetical protein
MDQYPSNKNKEKLKNKEKKINKNLVEKLAKAEDKSTPASLVEENDSLPKGYRPPVG